MIILFWSFGCALTNPMIIDVLRQLRSEINEENRLRELMVPIQQSMQDFESRLLKSVEAALTACFNKPGALSDAQLNAIQSSLNQAVTNNWSAFAASNKGDIVNEKNPQKNYLNINYSCKNDALVMTVHKGQFERRSGVLGRFAPKFFVITKCKISICIHLPVTHLFFLFFLHSWIFTSIQTE